MEQLGKPRHLWEDRIERTGSERIKSLDACFPLPEDSAFFSSAFALSVSHRIVFSPFMKPFTVAPCVASRVPPQSAAEIFRPKVYYRVLVVFLSSLITFVAFTLNLPNTAKAAEPICHAR